MYAALRSLLVVAFAASLAGVIALDDGRRLFWTVAIASLPVVWLIGGFHLWRRICPLAAMSRLGQLIGRPGPRRIGGWLSDHALMVQLVILTALLAIRLTATNGSALALVIVMGAVILAAMVIGAVFTGKTWCNYLCPLGAVERIYCEPVPGIGLGPSDSRCSPCTGCKRDCPDISLEQPYWKERDRLSRRLAYYAWPGVVLGFYLYFYLRTGGWDFYFSGAWAYEDALPERLADPGWFFAPAVPLIVAAPLTLLAGGLASTAILTAVERAGLSRHRTMTLAAAAGLIAFYAFAGQPTIALLPSWAARAIDVAVFGAVFAMVARRWPRSEADFVEQRYADKLLRAERRKEQTTRLDAYRETVLELVAEGALAGGARPLARLRDELGISEAEHEIIVRKAADPSPSGPLGQIVDHYGDELGQLGRGIAAARALDPDRQSSSLAMVEHLCRWRARQLEQRVERIADSASDSELARQALDRATEQFHRGVDAHSDDPTADLIALCGSGDPAVRAGAVFAMVKNDQPRARDAIVRATDDADPVVRESAFRALVIRGQLDGELARKARADADPRPRRAVLQRVTTTSATYDASAELHVLTTIERMMLLRSVALFGELEPEELEALSSIADDQRFGAGDILCRAGDIDQRVFVLIRGEVTVTAPGSGRIVHRAQAGDCIGELAALDPAPRSADVTAIQDGRALVLSGDSFRALLARRPALAELVMAVMAERLRSTTSSGHTS